jgi:hypothetical protein
MPGKEIPQWYKALRAAFAPGCSHRPRARQYVAMATRLAHEDKRTLPDDLRPYARGPNKNKELYNKLKREKTTARTAVHDAAAGDGADGVAAAAEEEQPEDLVHKLGDCARHFLYMHFDTSNFCQQAAPGARVRQLPLIF